MPDQYNNQASVAPRIIGSILRDLRGSALVPWANQLDKAQPLFGNNTVVDAKTGVAARAPDVLVKNNLFYRNSTALSRPSFSSSNLNANYNCLFANNVNFCGYPGRYGIPVIENRNGDPCDAFFNILLNPRLLAPNRFPLSSVSPCIDAGKTATTVLQLPVVGALNPTAPFD